MHHWLREWTPLAVSKDITRSFVPSLIALFPYIYPETLAGSSDEGWQLSGVGERLTHWRSITRPYWKPRFNEL